MEDLPVLSFISAGGLRATAQLVRTNTGWGVAVGALHDSSDELMANEVLFVCHEGVDKFAAGHIALAIFRHFVDALRDIE